MRAVVRLFLVVVVGFTSTATHSQTQPDSTAPAEIPLLQTTVVVSGEQPGPSLWRVSKGDNVLWILGTLGPTPKKMHWRSQEVEQIVAQSQEVLAAPSVAITSHLGIFRSLLLVPSLMGARKNPERVELKDVVSPELYARWTVLKKKYIGRDRSIEKWRPVFAAQELYEHAIKKVGLSSDPVVWPIVEKAAKRNKRPLTEPKVTVMIEDPKQMINEFAKSRLTDTECFAKTLDHLEGDIETMKVRANAWATADLATLRRLPYTDQGPTCINAVLNSSAAQNRGLDDLRARVAKVWQDAAEAALAKNAISFAVLPMAEILKPDGYIAALRAKGYLVEES